MALKKICIYFPATNITVAISVAESHNLIKREKNRWLSYKQHLRKSKHDFRKMQRAAFYAKKYHLAPWRVLGIDENYYRKTISLENALLRTDMTRSAFYYHYYKLCNSGAFSSTS